MLVTNKSDVRHTYRSPDRSNPVVYNWGPGETKDVPDRVAALMLRAHPNKFSVPALEVVQEATTEEITVEPTEVQEADEGPAARSRRRTTGGDG